MFRWSQIPEDASTTFHEVVTDADTGSTSDILGNYLNGRGEKLMILVTRAFEDPYDDTVLITRDGDSIQATVNGHLITAEFLCSLKRERFRRGYRHDPMAAARARAVDRALYAVYRHLGYQQPPFGPGSGWGGLFPWELEHKRDQWRAERDGKQAKTLGEIIFGTDDSGEKPDETDR